VNIFHAENKEKAKKYLQLPVCCEDSAECLKKQRAVYEKYGVFSKGLIDGIINTLKSYNDKKLRDQVAKSPTKMLELVEKYMHC
ncbi:MAG: glutamine synthetase, partial [Bacteroidales bacterium]|nr:glutamine synthetase [Bacteroidales bacterium]